MGLLDSTPVSVDCERLYALLMHLRHMDTQYHVANMTLVMIKSVLRPGWQKQRSHCKWSCLVLSAVSISAACAADALQHTLLGCLIAFARKQACPDDGKHHNVHNYMKDRR